MNHEISSPRSHHACVYPISEAVRFPTHPSKDKVLTYCCEHNQGICFRGQEKRIVTSFFFKFKHFSLNEVI